MNPCVAGITGPSGTSFEAKNALKHLDDYPNATEVKHLIDHEDLSFPYPCNAEIDHIFHIENGYMVHWHWNSFKSDGSLVHSKVGKPFFWAQNEMMRMFCERFGTRPQLAHMIHNTENLIKALSYYNSDLVSHLRKQVRSVYEEPLSYYF